MPIQYRCPHCNAEGSAEDQYAGQTGPCAVCGQTLTIPVAAAMPVQAPQKSSRSGLAIGLGCLVALVAVPIVLAIVGILIALLLPAVQAGREAARRTQCSNNIKQIELALLNYEAVHGNFPPAYTVNERGERLHSWRTLILPYLEQKQLYDQIALDEPWDSPANSLFQYEMVQVYGCPSSTSDRIETSYMVVVGDETIFPHDGKTTKISDIRDGSTIMVVEVADSGVHWMEPADLEFDQMSFRINGGLGEPGSNHHRTVNVGFGDGSVHTLPEDMNPQELRALLTKAGNERVNFDW